MAKFKNKKTGLVIEENLKFYIEKMRTNSNFEEIKEETKPKQNKKNREEEVESTPQK